MSFTLTVPETYGYVLIGCFLLPSATTLFMGGSVMSARTACDVKYPNLYATPGFHKEADAFNRVQRGHQAVLTESYPSFIVSTLAAGVRYPIAMAVTGVVWSVGSYLFMVGYSDTKLDVKDARYKKGGILFRAANAAGMIGVALVAAEMLGWK